MDRAKVIDTDYYVISNDFKLLDFNQNVKERYKGIHVGDLCYQATMKRDTPCPHCPIAGNSQNACPIYYDPFYRDWVEAIFSDIGDGNYAVTCHPASGGAHSMFQRLKGDDLSIEGTLLREYDTENIGIIGCYCEEGFPLYYVNECMAQMLGYDNVEDFEEGIDRKVINTIHPDDLPQVTEDLGENYYVGMRYETTYRMPRKDGTWFWTVDRGEVIETEDGRLAIISACLDVTREHEQQEARKRESDASASKDKIMSDIIRALYSYNATVNLETGKYTLSVGTGMESYIRQFSQTDDYVDACNLLLSNVLPEYVDEMNRQFSLDSLRKQQNHRGHIGQMIYAGFTENGIGWYEVNAFMGVDNEGMPIASVFGRDITETHLAQEHKENELRAVAARDQLLSDITKLLYGYNLTVHMNTGKYSLIEGNGMKQSVAYLKKHDQYEEVCNTFLQTTSPNQRPRAAELLSLDNYRGKTIKAGLVGTEEFYGNLPDGSTIWQEINVIAGFDVEGEPILHILGRNVTEVHEKADTKAQLEIEKAANAAKSAFLFNMSHDIRTPMNAILGFANLMEKEIGNPEKLLDYIRKIKLSGDSLLHIINNVLELSHLESGKETVNETLMDLSRDGLHVAPLFENDISAKNLTLTYDMDITHRYIYADVSKIRNITMNLLSNAVKYTPSGGSIHMHFQEYPSEKEGYAVYVNTVTDTGIGMSREFQERIFETFTREHDTTQSKVSGMGLGMSIVKRYVDLLGGKIEVESEPGKGSSFKVTLEHRLAEEKKEEASTEQVVELRGNRILLAEDNELNAEIAIAILEDTGVEVERAADGTECVEMLQAASVGYYNLILMDIQMPRQNGYEATKQIRGMPDTGKASIPIIAMTANAFEEDKQNAIRAGMNGHLAKPIEIPKLMETLSSVLCD